MKSKSDAQLRFDRTLEALALVWAETIKQLSATQAERDAALAENKRLAELNDTRLILLTAQTRTALSKAKVLEQDLSTARESLYTVAEQRNSALAERDAALAELATLKAPCTHRNYTESSNGRVRQCRKCFKSWDVRVGNEDD